MSIWGKVLGGAAGFALGGPLGALLGAAAGHAVDAFRAGGDEAEGKAGKVRQREPSAEREGLTAMRQIAFTIGVIVLGAKLAKSDGKVTRDEVDAFKRVFHVPQHELKNVGRLFDRARGEAGGFEPYARQIAAMFKKHPAVLEKLLDGLFHIAKADGVVGPLESEYLHAVARIFGLSDQQFERVRVAHVGGAAGDPYIVLGISRKLTNAEIKSAYRKLILETHPDRLMAEGLPKEFIDMATQRLAAINAAYDRIAAERGIK